MKCEQFREDVEALLSGELDERTACEAREHADSCATCAKILRSAGELADALKAQGVLPMPASVESRIRTRRGEVGGRIRRPAGALRRRVWAFAGVLVSVFVIGGLLLMRQQPVTASEIIARAEAASRRHHSWHLVFNTTTGGKSPKDRRTYTHELWYKAPDSFKHFSSTFWYTIHNGVHTSCYPVQKTLRLWPITNQERKRLSETRCTMPVDPADDAFKTLKNVRVNGTAEVNGRLCDVIEGAAAWIRNTTVVKYYIDRETGLMMRRQLFREGKWFYEQQLTRWELDIPIADSVFEVKPPPGTAVVKGNIHIGAAYPNYLLPASVAQAQCSSYLSMTALKGLALKKTYWLSYLPGGYLFDTCYPTAVDKDSRALGMQTDYAMPASGYTLAFVQTTEGIDEGGESVRSGDFVGKAVEGTDPYPYVRLTWTANGACYMITASALPLDEVVKVAKSLQPCSAAPSPIAARPSVLEFYWLKDIRSAKNPNARWGFASMVGKDKSYVFNDMRGPHAVSIDSIKQPKEVMDKVVQPKRNPPVLTSRDMLPTARAEINRNRAVVNIQFNARGTKIFAEFTRRHKGAVLAVFSDGRLLTAPTIQEAIQSGSVQITGFNTLEEAQQLAARINGSAPPAK